jgi:hypothetical protein
MKAPRFVKLNLARKIKTVEINDFYRFFVI